MEVDIKDKKVLNVGCGTKKIPGAVNMDYDPKVEPEVVWNVDTYPWPFEDNTFDLVFCSHILEHTIDINAFMRECYRILKPEGIHHSISPFHRHVSCWASPEHRRAITEETMMYFSRTTRNSDGRMFVEGMDFQILTAVLHMDKRFRREMSFDEAVSTNNAVENIEYRLKAIKPMRGLDEFKKVWAGKSKQTGVENGKDISAKV